MMTSSRRLESVFAVIAAAGFLLTGAAAAEGLQIGASSNDVIMELGPPLGVMSYGETNVMLYDEGTVSFSGGKVTAIDIMSHEAYLKEKEDRRIREEQWAKDAEARRIKRIEDGQSEFIAKKNDPAFAQWTAENRLAFWESFQRRYPETPVGAEVMACRREVAAGPQSPAQPQPQPQVQGAAQGADPLEAVRLQAAGMMAQIDAHRKTLYAPDRTSTKSQRRRAHAELRRLIPEINALRAQLGEPPMVLDPTPPEETSTDSATNAVAAP